MAHDVVLIPGDGIGPGCAGHAPYRAVEGCQGPDQLERPGGRRRRHGRIWHAAAQHVLDAVAETKVAIKGPITTPVGATSTASTWPCASTSTCAYRALSVRPGDGSRFRDVDLVIVRENTGDLYAGIEFDEGAAEVEGSLRRALGKDLRHADSAISDQADLYCQEPPYCGVCL